MAIPTINIGISKNGKDLVHSVDTHFALHEPLIYENLVLSSFLISPVEKGEIKGEESNVSDYDGIRSWFENDLYSKINNLEGVVNGNAGSRVIVNIIVPIVDTDAIDNYKLLLDVIKELNDRNLVSLLSIRVFSIIYSIDKDRDVVDGDISTKLKEFASVSAGFDSIIHDIYYIDDRNIDATILGLDKKWLGFALGEFFVYQINEAGSLASLKKEKVFGLGVIHFNEVLFRDVISNKILEYKFKEEGLDDEDSVQVQDIVNTCNPFIEKYQNFFDKFIELYPYNEENNKNISKNAKDYVESFKNDLDEFITDNKYNLDEAKVILANLIGEDDEKLSGVQWEGDRLNLKDLEYDIIEYFNQFLEDEDRVNRTKEKKLRERISDLQNSIKHDKRSLKRIEEDSKIVNSDLDISFEEGVFSVDGKRINASGYIPSPINPGDETYSFEEKAIPNQIDLSDYFGPVKNQGELGSCTAFPVAGVYEFFAKRNNNIVDISEQFIYYNTRKRKGNENEDSGATLLDTVNSLKELGACYSSTCPYIIDNYNVSPTEEAYVEAKHQVVEKAVRVEVKEDDFKHAIANGYPVIFGLKLYKSFYSKDGSGIIPYPSPHEKSHDNHGNHAMLIVGYNDDEKLFKVRNSWGTSFGDNGYCYIPYDYIANEEFCLEAFIIMSITDLSYNELSYDSSASFSFLKDVLVRRKIILEYRIRENNRKLLHDLDEFKVIVVENESNTEKIKDPLNRKSLYRSFEDKRKENNNSLREGSVPDTGGSGDEKDNKTHWYFIAAGIVLLIASSLLTTLITFIGAIISSIIGVGLLTYGIYLYLSEQNKVKKQNEVIFREKETERSNKEEQEIELNKDIYRFKVADGLFSNFDRLEGDLIKRYKGISKYFTSVKSWNDESKEALSSVDFSTPTFVFNVIKEKSLLDYVEIQRQSFLDRLPNLVNVFHDNFRVDNDDDIFLKLKTDYLNHIKSNIDEIIDVSVIKYLLGDAKYDFFENRPALSDLCPNMEKVSKPFCNLKENGIERQYQHFVIKEKLDTTQQAKYKSTFDVERDPANIPVTIDRDDNRRKIVAIQIADIDGIESLVRYGG